MDIKETEKKLEELRKLWKDRPDLRGITRVRGKMLKFAIELYYRNHPEEAQIRV